MANDYVRAFCIFANALEEMHKENIAAGEVLMVLLAYTAQLGLQLGGQRMIDLLINRMRRAKNSYRRGHAPSIDCSFILRHVFPDNKDLRTA